MDGHYKNKVIYLSMLPINNYIKTNFYYNELSKMYKVEFWDVSQLVNYPNYKKKNTFLSFQNLKEKINQNKKNIFISLLTYDLKTYKIHRLLYKMNCFLIYFNWGSQPIKYKKNIYEKLIELKLNNTKNLIYQKLNYIIYNISFFFGLLKKPELEFVAGNFLYNSKGKNKKVKINLHDNDFFLKSKEIKKKDKYFLFIDNNMSDHEDGKYIFGNKIFNFIIYQKNLENFFRFIEKKFNTKVIIAPYYKYKRSYENFLQSRFGKKHISRLVREAAVVMLHHTTAISYPVLNYKPIIFLTNTQIENSPIKQFSNDINALSIFLDSIKINTNNFSNFKIPIVNKLKYEKYIDLFIGSKKNNKKI